MPGYDEIIGKVREGMDVRDPSGPVAPVAPTGPLGTAGGPMGAPAGIFALGQVGATEPDVPPSFTERLIRTGFVKVNTKGIFTRDVYVPADQISDVDADQVFIDLKSDELIKES